MWNKLLLLFFNLTLGLRKPVAYDVRCSIFLIYVCVYIYIQTKLFLHISIFMYRPVTLILGPKCLQCRKDCPQERFFFLWKTDWGNLRHSRMITGKGRAKEGLDNSPHGANIVWQTWAQKVVLWEKHVALRKATEHRGLLKQH